MEILPDLLSIDKLLLYSNYTIELSTVNSQEFMGFSLFFLSCRKVFIFCIIVSRLYNKSFPD